MRGERGRLGREKAGRLETAQQQAVQVAVVNHCSRSRRRGRRRRRRRRRRPRTSQEGLNHQLHKGPTPPDSHCCWLPGGVPAWTLKPGFTSPCQPWTPEVSHLQLPGGLL